jgi:NAD(P)-dependent dehydrogenase (short-subunit alcohol dehydrogenase family)
LEHATVAVDKDVEALKWVDDHPSIVACVADVSTEDGNDAMASLVGERFGRLEATVLNAAVFPARRIERIPMSDFDQLVAVNLRGVVLGLRAVLPMIRDSGGGAVLVTSSVAGMFGAPKNAAYAATSYQRDMSRPNANRRCCAPRIP